MEEERVWRLTLAVFALKTRDWVTEILRGSRYMYLWKRNAKEALLKVSTGLQDNNNNNIWTYIAHVSTN